MSRRTYAQWRSPEYGPARAGRQIIGIVWEIASGEAASDAIADIGTEKYHLSPGSMVKSVSFFPASDDKGFCAVLIEFGTMFSANFPAVCGVHLGRYKAVRLTDQKRINAFIHWAEVEWEKDQKRQHKARQPWYRKAKK